MRCGDGHIGLNVIGDDIASFVAGLVEVALPRRPARLPHIRSVYRPQVGMR